MIVVTLTPRTLIPNLLLGALPVALTIGALWVADTEDLLAIDFHNELYRQAKDVLDWTNPYPASDADLTSGANAIWPMAAVFLVTPLALLPPQAADWVMTGIELACLGGALWLLRVRDWRVYGAALLWPPVINAVQSGNATLPLAVLCAVTWRYRRHRFVPGVAVGVALALKFFLWPLVLWLAVVRRPLAALLAVAIGAASMLLILPFESIGHYIELVRNLSRTFDHHSYTLYALLVEIGVPSGLARAVWAAVGLAVLALAWRQRSLTLSIGAALLLTPIAWLHFFALMLVPLAIVRPAFSPVWLVPLVTWLAPGTLNGDPWQQVVVLGSFAVLLAYCERAERATSSAVSVAPNSAAKRA